MKRAVIFDFDGTIADSFELVGEVAARLMNKEDEFADKQFITELRGLPALEIAKRLGVPWWRLPMLLSKGKKEIQHRVVREAPLFPEMGPVIRGLHAQGITLYIASSNSVENIELFLRAHKLDAYFSQVYGNVSLLFGGKVRVMKQVMREHGLDRAHCWYIGDEVRDVVAARQARVSCIAVSWGFNTAESLKNARPTALARMPEDILQIVEQWKK